MQPPSRLRETLVVALCVATGAGCLVLLGLSTSAWAIFAAGSLFGALCYAIFRPPTPASDMSPRIGRHWLQFSLRTFLFAVAIIGGWLASNVYGVNKRRETLEMLRFHGAVIRTYDDSKNVVPRSPVKSLPAVWVMMGVTPIDMIQLGEGFTEEDEQSVRHWFPEANVVGKHSHGGGMGMGGMGGGFF